MARARDLIEELTATQMAEHLAKRKELWEARENNARNPRETPGRPKGFAGETEADTGVSRRRVQEAVSRADGVAEEIRESADRSLLSTSLSSSSDL